VDLPEAVLSKINISEPSAQSSSASPGGCVDAGLYARFTANFTRVTPNSFWRSFANLLPQQTSQAKTHLDDAEVRAFDAALEAGGKAGTAFLSIPFHCVVGTKAG